MFLQAQEQDNANHSCYISIQESTGSPARTIMQEINNIQVGKDIKWSLFTVNTILYKEIPKNATKTK